MDFRYLIHGFEIVDLAGVNTIILVCAIEETGEVYPFEIQAIYSLRTVRRASDPDDNEHRAPGFVHSAFVMAQLILIAPCDLSVFLCPRSVLDLHPEPPAGGFLPESEIRIDHRVDEFAVGVIVGGCAMDELELLRVEHGDDVILEIVPETVEESALLLLASLLFEKPFPFDPSPFLLLLAADTPFLKCGRYALKDRG